jgi:hypothetical protein
MKNPATLITKDGVSDADLMRAARDMYEALEGVLGAVGAKGDRQYIALSMAAKALAKARGES